MTAVFVVLVLVSIALLYRSAKSELAPQEDQGFVLAQPTYAPDATLQQKLLYGIEAYDILKAKKGYSDIFQIEAPGQSFTGVPLGPLAGRKLGSTDIQSSLQQKPRHGGRRRRSWSFSRRPCPVHSACPCSSPSRPPSPRCA